MASTTTNLGLTKPAYTDSADVAVINSNMDILDTKIGAIGNTSVASQIGTLSEHITKHTVTDLNNAKDASCPYYFVAANTASNYPPTTVMSVEGFTLPGNNGRFRQVAFTSGDEVFIRQYSGSAWIAWEQLARKNNIVNDEDSTKTAFSQYTGNGIWYLNIGNMSDKPTGASGWGYVMTMYKSNQNYQMLFVPTNEAIFARRYYGSAWGSWQQVAAASSLNVAASYNTDVISSGTVKYHKYGKLVVVSLDFTLSQAVSATGVELVRNLPETSGDVWLTVCGYNDNKSYRLRMATTKITTFYSNTLPAQTYNGFVTYIANV